MQAEFIALSILYKIQLQFLKPATANGASFGLILKAARRRLEIVKLADWDTVKSNVFAKTAIRYIQSLPEARLLKFVVMPFEMDGME